MLLTAYASFRLLALVLSWALAADCGSTAGQGVGISRAAVDMHFTQTMFIAAQVHRQLGDFTQSAHCCAVTLQLQLQSGDPCNPKP